MMMMNDDECVNKVHELIQNEAKVAKNPYFDMLIGKNQIVIILNDI